MKLKNTREILENYLGEIYEEIYNLTNLEIESMDRYEALFLVEKIRYLINKK